MPLLINPKPRSKPRRRLSCQNVNQDNQSDRKLSDVFNCVMQWMRRLNVHRVSNARNLVEYDQYGIVCRACLIGALRECRKSNVISFVEWLRASSAVHKVMNSRGDTARTLRTVKTRADMFNVFKQAAVA